MSSPIAPADMQARMLDLGHRLRAELLDHARREGEAASQPDHLVGCVAVTALMLAAEANGALVYGVGQALGRAMAQLGDPADRVAAACTLSAGVNAGVAEAEAALTPRGSA